MKKLTLLLLSIFFGSAYAQHLPDYSLNKVKLIEKDRILAFEVKPLGDQETKADRLYYWYSGNVLHTTQGGFSGKLLHGSYNEYFTNKSLKEQGHFQDGLKTGLWKSWREDGTLDHINNWKQGILDGEFTVYDEKGLVRQSGQFNAGVLNGKLLTYHSKDSVTLKRYHNGLIMPEQKASASFWEKVKHFRLKRKSDSISAPGSGIPPQSRPRPTKKSS